MKYAFLAILSATCLAIPASGQPIQFSTVIRGDVGYGTNPFLRHDVDKAALVGTISIAPRAVYSTGLATTAVSGQYSRDQYTGGYGYTDQLSAGVVRTDQLSAHLHSTLSANYRSSNKATIAQAGDVDYVDDPLDYARRTRTLSGSAQLQWQASGNDSFNFGANASHRTTGRDRSGIGLVTSGYDSYGVSGGYNRVIDARTSVGAQLSVNTVRSDLYPNSRSIQPSLTARRQITAIWNVSGHLGLVMQKIDGPFGRSTTSLGYGLNACGVYPRTTVCVSADRSSQPSGAGGLRTSTSASASVKHDLTAQSRVEVFGRYNKSESVQPLSPLIGRRTRAFLASVDYDHDVSQRVSVGCGGRYQTRSSAIIGSGHAITATIHASAKLGRI